VKHDNQAESMEDKRPYKIDRKKIGIVIGSMLTLVLLLVVTTWRNRAEVRNIVVNIVHLPDGNDLIKEKDVREILRRSLDRDLENARLGQVEVARVEELLNQDPFVQKSEAFVDANNDLNIKIEQRTPLLRIIDNTGQNYYLDKNGIRMPMSRYYSARVPIVTGAIPAYMNDFLNRQGYGLKNVFDLVNRLNADEFFAPMVQQIVMDANGDFTLIPILGDQKIRLGSLDNLDEKLQRLKTFYQEAMPYEGWKKYASISVKYKNQIVCKKK
jgi:cell division protein FtsQ